MRGHRILFLGLFLLGAANSFAYSPAKHFAEGTKGAFTDSNKWIWVGGTLLTLAAFHYDHDIYKHYATQEKEELPDSVGDTIGTGIPGAGIALLTMGAGWLWGNRALLGAGQSHAEALLATFAYTSTLKLVVERDRPPAFSNKESAFNASFPSGHTSTAFATAGSIMASAGPRVGWPFLALAVLTGYSRVQQRAHYTGDVIFGATLGYTMGTGFYKHHENGQSLGFQILPYFDSRESWGLALGSGF
ncbi:MAG: phosphatase PAP2 family protein [Bdellovibrionales bacterium]